MKKGYIKMEEVSKGITFYLLTTKYMIFQRNRNDDFVKSHEMDGTVKSSRCKAHESLGMRRTYSTPQ